MNDLLLTALIIALIYYAFFYRPPKTNPLPTKPTFTQTEPTQADSELEATLDNLLQEINQLCLKIN